MREYRLCDSPIVTGQISLTMRWMDTKPMARINELTHVLHTHEKRAAPLFLLLFGDEIFPFYSKYIYLLI